MDSPIKVDNAVIYRGERLFRPLQIVIATMDKRCPACGKSTRDDMGLDLGYEHGRIFGGVCFHCGWSFGVDG